MDRTQKTVIRSATDDERSNAGRHASVPVVNRATVLLTLLVISWLGLRAVPPGVCFGDGGGLQLASATLGITHPPGYPLLVSIGYLISRLPFADPAYVVNIACCLSGVVVLWLLIRLQVHLGASTLAACILSLVVAQHPRFWANLTSPEVYMPTLGLLATGIWLLARYSMNGARRSLWIGGLLLGMAAVTRPPLLSVIPFAVVSIWMAQRARRSSFRDALKSALVPLVGLALSASYVAGYLWCRDDDKTAFNYIQRFNAEHRSLPEVNGGWRDQAQRMWWHASAQQYQDMLNLSVPGVRSRLRMLGRRIVPDHSWPVWPVLLLATVGGVTAFRRRPPTGVLLLGVIGGAVAFFVAYNVLDDAADVLPVLFVVAACTGVAISLIFHDGSGAFRTWIVRMAFFGMLVAMPLRVVALPHASQFADATNFLDAANLQALPPDSIVLCSWHQSTPLLYAKFVWGQANHVTVIIASPKAWGMLIVAFEGRPIYLTQWRDKWPAYALEPHGSLWHLVRK